jgi:hypothetical protein
VCNSRILNNVLNVIDENEYIMSSYEYEYGVNGKKDNSVKVNYANILARYRHFVLDSTKLFPLTIAAVFSKLH